MPGAVCRCCERTENPRIRARGARQIRARSRGDRGASRGGSQARNVASECQVSSLPRRARVHQEGGSASGEEAHRDWRHQAEAEDIASQERTQSQPWTRAGEPQRVASARAWTLRGASASFRALRTLFAP